MSSSTALSRARHAARLLASRVGATPTNVEITGGCLLSGAAPSTAFKALSALSLHTHSSADARQRRWGAINTSSSGSSSAWASGAAVSELDAVVCSRSLSTSTAAAKNSGGSSSSKTDGTSSAESPRTQQQQQQQQQQQRPAGPPNGSTPSPSPRADASADTLPPGLTEEERRWLGELEEAAAGIDEDDDDEGSQLMAAVERLVGESSRLFDQGRPGDAVKLLQEGIVAASEDVGDDAAELVPMWEHLSLLQLLMGALPESRAAAAQALQLARQHYDDGEPAVAVCRLRLGVVDAVERNAGAARALLRPAHEVMARELGEEYEGTGESLYYDTLAALWSCSTPAQVRELTPMLVHAALMMATALSGGGRGISGDDNNDSDSPPFGPAPAAVAATATKTAAAAAAHPLLRFALLQHSRLLAEADPAAAIEAARQVSSSASSSGTGSKKGGGGGGDADARSAVAGVLLALHEQALALHEALHPEDRHVALLLSHTALLHLWGGDAAAAEAALARAEGIVRGYVEAAAARGGESGGGGSGGAGGRLRRLVELQQRQQQQEGEGVEGEMGEEAKEGEEEDVASEDEAMLHELLLRRGTAAALRGDAALARPLLQQAREFFASPRGRAAAGVGMGPAGDSDGSSGAVVINAFEAEAGVAEALLRAAAGDAGERRQAAMEEAKKHLGAMQRALGDRHVLVAALQEHVRST